MMFSPHRLLERDKRRQAHIFPGATACKDVQSVFAFKKTSLEVLLVVGQHTDFPRTAKPAQASNCFPWADERWQVELGDLGRSGSKTLPSLTNLADPVEQHDGFTRR